MNLLILLGLVAVWLPVQWAVQSLVMWRVGLPLTAPLRYQTEVAAVRWTGRLSIQALWLLVLIAFPYAIGDDPVAYFSSALSVPSGVLVPIAFLVTVLVLGGGYLTEIAAGWVRFSPQLDATTRRRKLFRRFLSPLPVALLEESVFRGVLLEQLRRALPDGATGAVAAVVVSSAVFSAVHFIRPLHHEIRAWRAAMGLFAVGLVLGTAFVAAGGQLWLPIAIHAGGILITEVARLYVRYEASPTLIGYSTFPHCGLIGLASLSLLMAVILTTVVPAAAAEHDPSFRVGRRQRWFPAVAVSNHAGDIPQTMPNHGGLR